MLFVYVIAQRSQHRLVDVPDRGSFDLRFLLYLFETSGEKEDRAFGKLCPQRE